MQAFSKLAKTNNTVLLPEKTGDVGSMVAQVRTIRCFPQKSHLINLTSLLPQAMSIFGHMMAKGPQNEDPGGTSPVSPPPETETDKKDDIAPESLEAATSSVMQDLEATLNKLTQDIGDTLKSSTDNKRVEEPPHFTIATSPTRPQYQDPSSKE